MVVSAAELKKDPAGDVLFEELFKDEPLERSRQSKVPFTISVMNIQERLHSVEDRVCPIGDYIASIHRGVFH